MNMDNRWAYRLRRAVTAAVMVAAVAVVAGLTGSDPAAQDLGKAVPSETHSGWIGGDEAKSGMLWVQGGKFRFGSDDQYSEEGPVQEVRVDGFWIDRTEVTNAQFQRFVGETGYVTEAERGFGTDPLQPLQRGSVVFFNPVTSAGSMTDWWQFVEGANWRHPEGPGSSIKGREEHPVVHVTYADALAYARWLGHDLPTEAQWEYAARGGLDGAEYAWGGEYTPEGLTMANTWQGFFPVRNTLTDGFSATAPVGSFRSNGYGAYDMIGNVWEWTSDWYRPRHAKVEGTNPKGPGSEGSHDPRQPGVAVRVIKGGSFLCAQNFCRRYRPASRHAQEVSLGASHLGFRTVNNEVE